MWSSLRGKGSGRLSSQETTHPVMHTSVNITNSTRTYVKRLKYLSNIGQSLVQFGMRWKQHEVAGLGR
jgi:hypothetical protein